MHPLQAPKKLLWRKPGGILGWDGGIPSRGFSSQEFELTRVAQLVSESLNTIIEIEFKDLNLYASLQTPKTSYVEYLVVYLDGIEDKPPKLLSRRFSNQEFNENNHLWEGDCPQSVGSPCWNLNRHEMRAKEEMCEQFFSAADLGALNRGILMGASNHHVLL